MVTKAGEGMGHHRNPMMAERKAMVKGVPE